MASILLRRRRVLPKEIVSQESAQRDGNHDPSIVCHKYKPANISIPYGQSRGNEKSHLHEHEGVKVLECVEDRLDEMGPLARGGLVLSWREERRGLSNGSRSSICIVIVVSSESQKP